MAIGWYITPYNRRPGHGLPTRYCAMDDHTSIIRSSSGAWAESEVLGNLAIVKVRSPGEILTFLDEQPGFYRLPRNRLNDSLSSLSGAVRTQMRDRLLTAGYTIEEIRAAFDGGLENYTFRDYLRFFARRRLKPRYDRSEDEIVLDGPVQECRSIERVDEEITE